MARYSEHDRSLIDSTVSDWKARCLVGDASLFDPARENVWTGQAAGELYERLNSHVSSDNSTFMQKWAAQLENASGDVRLFAAELLLVYLLFPSSVSGNTKRSMVAETLATSFLIDEASTPMRALAQRIGNPGIGYSVSRDRQIAYLIDFTRRLKARAPQDRADVLADPWRLRTFADDTDESVREMRHVLLHLLHPDDFERIASLTHKREIAAAFADLLDEQASEDLDERLLAIRGKLEGLMPEGNTPGSQQVDFYHPPLRGVWESSGRGDGDGTGDLEVLRWKKQIVLYGPPGTSKSFRARRLAETIIRRAALERWKPAGFFHHQQELEQMLESCVRWIQLHPRYGYEEFIRGLRLDGSETRYEPGALPKIIDEMAAQAPPDGLEPLPFVLVLDEINRTDLSALFGEAFSLIERDRRGEPGAELPGLNPGDPVARLVIPEDLYIIGTMNEIDQSVETLDFALRRRFLWSECPFERDTLLDIISSRWADDIDKRWNHEAAAPQLEHFADRASALNDAIENSEELGRAYQVGHTYFADITFFLGTWLRGRQTAPANGTFLWTGRGRPQPPLADLWERSLRPLLEQYLAGSDTGVDELLRLRNVLLEP